MGIRPICSILRLKLVKEDRTLNITLTMKNMKIHQADQISIQIIFNLRVQLNITHPTRHPNRILVFAIVEVNQMLNLKAIIMGIHKVHHK